MVFHRSFSDSKSPQISSTLLTILTNLNHAVFWIVSIQPPISNSSSLLFKSLQLVSPSPSFSLSDPLGRQSQLYSMFSFFSNYHLVWSSCWDLIICLYLKTLENFMSLILQERFWFVNVSFGSMVKFQFLAQFPVNPLPYPVMSFFILLLH